MFTSKRPFLSTSIASLVPVLALISAPPGTQAADISKANNNTNLSLTGSYTGGVLPTSADRISFDATAATASNLTALTFDATAASNLSILGIVVTAPAGPVTINNQPQNVAGSTFNLGASGIDMTTATQSLTINAGISLSASQAFDVASSRTLTLGTNTNAQGGLSLGSNVLTVQGAGTTAINDLIYGSGSISKAGGGTLTLNNGLGSGAGQNTGNFFSGGINQSAGVINISSVNASGTGAISLTGGTMTISQSQFLLTNGATVNGGTLNVNSNVGIAGGTVTLTSGTLSSNTANAFQYVTVAANGGTFTPSTTTANTIGALSGSVGFTSGAFALSFGSNNATATYSGNIAGAVASNLTKTGSGTQVLNGTNATSGTITVNGSGGTLEIGNTYANSTNVAAQSGTLKLNFATNNVATDLVKTAPLSLSGGTLSVVGQNTATNVAQNFTGTTTTAATSSTISAVNGSSTGTTAVNIGGITRGAGSVINFNIAGTPSATNGILTSTGAAGLFVGTGNQAYTTVNGTDFAAKDAGNTFVQALTGSVTATGGTSLTGTATDNADITGGNISVSAASSINTVRFNDSVARTLTLTAGALTVTDSGILVSSAVTGAGSKITGAGTITSGTDLIVHQFSAQPFTLDVAVTGATILTKAGSGTLILTKGNSNSGLTYVTSGTLQIGAGGNVGGNSVLQVAPNDPTAVFDVNNQTTTVGNIGGGGATGGYVTLGSTGTINDISGFSATFNGALVGGVGSTFNKTGGNNGFQGANQAFYGTLNVTGTGSIGVFGGGGFINANVNVSATGNAFSQGGSGTTVALGNISGTGGTLIAGSSASANGTYNFGYLGGNTSFAGVFANGTNATPGLTSIGKFGSGTTTLSGNNTYTGTTTINSGGVIFDYSTGSTTALATGSTLTLGGGTATFKGASTGAATAIGTGTFTNSQGQLERLTLDNNTNANGVAVTLKTAVINGANTLGTTTTSNVIIFDTSSSSANALKTDLPIGAATASASDTIAIRTNNGLLTSGTGAASILGYRADVLIKDSTGLGFATTGAGNSIVRYTAGTSLNGNTAGTLAEDGTGNYVLTANLTRTNATFLYNTLTLDTSSSAVTLVANNIDTFTRFGAGSASTSGRGVLAIGSNGAAITDGGGTNQATYFYNYQTGTTAGQTLTLNVPLFGNTFSNGTGLTVATDKVDSGDLYIQSGVFRETLAQSSGDALTPGAGLVRLYGGVLEIGAHLTGTTSATSTADFSRSVGANAGQIQLMGDTGFSAFGANRTVNLGGSATPTLLVWGQDSFLVSPSGNSVEGNQTFKLSSAFSNATLDFQNPIALGSTTRQVDVADGSSPVDAILSGVLSGVAPLTVVTANGAPAITRAAAGLTKLGAGTLQLSAANTYTGPTRVSAGTLEVSGSLSATTTLNISNGTLLLSGNNAVNSTANAVIISATGTLAQSGSGKTDLLGSLTLSPGATLDFGGGDSNTLTFTSLPLFGAFSVKGWTGTEYVPGQTDAGAATQDRLLFNTSTGLSALQLASINFFDDAGAQIGFGAAQINFGGSQFELVPIPEPSSTALLGGMGLLGLVGFRERRRLTKQG